MTANVTLLCGQERSRIPYLKKVCKLPGGRAGGRVGGWWWTCSSSLRCHQHCVRLCLRCGEKKSASTAPSNFLWHKTKQRGEPGLSSAQSALNGKKLPIANTRLFGNSCIGFCRLCLGPDWKVNIPLSSGSVRAALWVQLD